MTQEQCSQKTQLLANYQRGSLEYVNSLTELQANMGRMPKEHYDTLYKRLEVLKAGADKAKFYYDSHVHEHGC
jgi:hypothetical protein